MNLRRLGRLLATLLGVGWAGACLAATAAGPAGPTGLSPSADPAAQSRALQRASDAVLGVRVETVDGARSNATLGQLREGSGVVIGGEGLVLTIGYLVLEAETVTLLPDDGRQVPARVVAYDLATGFGLVQALAPLRLEPAPLARTAALAPREALAFVSGGPQGVVSAVRLLERRPFSGSWEYHIEGAIYTEPARRDQSGAGLFNERGELVGIGSLFLGQAAGSGPRRPGNMFVPVDLLTPVFEELRARGRSQASERPWLGINCEETAEGLRIVRVSDDSPADVAGLQAGDTIERIDGVEVRALARLWQTLWSKGPPEREVQLQIRREGAVQTLKVYSVDRMKTFKRPEGV